ncbi:Transcription elongation factor spt6, partial [Gonapodya sp. JEL0774]
PQQSRSPKDPEKKKKRKKERDNAGSDEEGEDTARPSSKNPHLYSDEESDEESEIEDVEAAQKEFEGFIVDEPDSGEEDEGQKRKRDVSDDDASDVEEEDLDLIRENTGLQSRKLKRLRRNRIDDEDDEDNAMAEDRGKERRDDYDDDDDLAGMFERDAGKRGQPIEYDLADDSGESIDDFIEDDEPGGEELDEETKRARKAERARNRQRAHARENAGASEDWLEMFDASDYAVVPETKHADAAAARSSRPSRFEDDDDEEELGREGAGMKTGPAKLSEIWEPTVIAEKLLTEADEIIRSTDIPERYQLRNERGTYTITSSESEIHREGVYISYKMAHELRNTKYITPESQTAIKKVLQFMRDEERNLLEVPFIISFRKDHWVGHLEPSDLWKISEMDEDFQQVDAQSQALIPLVEQARKWSYRASEDPVIEKIEEKVDSAVAAEDIRRYIRMHYGEEITRGEEEAKAGRAEDPSATATRPGGDTKRSLSRFQNLRAAGMVDAAAGFHVELRRFLSGVYDALVNSQNVKRHYPEEEPATPLEFFERFTKPKSRFSRAEVVMAAARSAIAEQIAAEPELRAALRGQFQQVAVVNVEPTDKGKAIITERDPNYFFKYIKAKPVSEFTDGQFAAIVRCEDEGLLKATIRLTETTEDALFNAVKYHIRSDGASDLAAAWNVQRDKIVEEALDMVIRDTVKWLRQKMFAESSLYIAKKAAENLEQKLMRAPFEPRSSSSGDDDDDDDERDSNGLNLVVVSWGMGNRNDAAHVVTVNSDGALKGVMRMHHLQDRKVDGVDSKEKNEELITFKDLVGRTRPDVVVVAGESVKTRFLFAEIQKAVEDTAQMYRRKRGAPEVIYGMDEVARIWRTSKEAVQEFPEHSEIVRYCVAVGRMVQDPLMAYATLFDLEGSISRLQFSPHQSAVPKELLLKHFLRAFMNATAIVGVDVNQAIRFHHLSHTLQFVSGLGPRKAMGLLMKARQLAGQRIISRQQLIIDEETGVKILGARVFYNCASFIRIRGHHFTRNIALDVLDDTRIHLEDYDLARKMAADAMDADDMDEQEEDNPSRHVEELLDGNQKRLDDLLLDDYAIELEKRIGEPKKLLLLDIKKELQDPYGERRKPFFNESSEDLPEEKKKLTYDEEVFTMLTGETDETWQVGTVVSAFVDRIIPPRDEGQSGVAIIVFENGLDARVTPRDRFGPNAPMDLKIADMLQRGQSVLARIRGFDKKLWRTEVTIREKEEFTPQRDPRFDKDRETADKSKKQRDIAKAAAEFARPDLSHPFYHRDWGMQESEDYLAKTEIGTLVVRPSSTPGNLVAVMKFDQDSYWHIGIHHSLSNRGQDQWTVKDTTTTFESLDHLINIYLEPMVSKMRELRAHSKFFKNKKLKVVEKELLNQLIRQPNRSTYGFCSADTPGFFYLVYMFSMNSPAEHERVYLIPGKFKFREREYSTVDDLLRFFKMNPKRQPTTGGVPGRIPMSQYGGPRPGTAYGSAPAMRAGIQGYQTPANYTGGYGATVSAGIGAGMPIGYSTPGYGMAAGGAGAATPGYGVPVNAGVATPGYNAGWQQGGRR